MENNCSFIVLKEYVLQNLLLELRDFFPDVAMVWSQAVTFTYTESELWWGYAKTYCECIGHLVILDTEQKQLALLNQV